MILKTGHRPLASAPGPQSTGPRWRGCHSHPQRGFWQCLETFLLVRTWGHHRYLVGRRQNTAKHPSMDGRPPAKNYPSLDAATVPLSRDLVPRQKVQETSLRTELFMVAAS